jgi:uncharacterized membrane protein YhhN
MGGSAPASESRRLLIAATAVTLVAAAGMLASRGIGIPSIYAKMTAASGFLVAAWAAGAFHSRYGRAVFAGLVFSWFGDLFLALPGKFLSGLVAFLIGHIGYSVAFVLHGIRPAAALGALAALVLPAAGLFLWLNPHLSDEMRDPVHAYMAVITTMLALSVGAWQRQGTVLMALAALMFWLSDIFVARQAFVAPGAINGIIGLPLYFGGQLVFAWSIAALGRRQLTSPAQH